MRALGEAAAEHATGAAAAAAGAEQGPAEEANGRSSTDGNAAEDDGGSSSSSSSEGGSTGSTASAGSGITSAGLMGTVRRDPRLEGLTPPMIPGNQEVTTVSCFIQARRRLRPGLRC